LHSLGGNYLGVRIVTPAEATGLLEALPRDATPRNDKAAADGLAVDQRINSAMSSSSASSAAPATGRRRNWRSSSHRVRGQR